MWAGVHCTLTNGPYVHFNLTNVPSVAESRDWHHSGAERQLLCTNCRHHFKKYGAMRIVQGKPERPPASMCREQTPSSNEEAEAGAASTADGGIRTRSARNHHHNNHHGNNAHRRRTPNEFGERTPNRGGVDSEGERRSTPQRNVKVRKRSYNVSTGSVDEVSFHSWGGFGFGLGFGISFDNEKNQFRVLIHPFRLSV